MTRSVSTHAPRVRVTRSTPFSRIVKAIAELFLGIAGIGFALPPASVAQSTATTGPQQLAFAGLRTVVTQGIPQGQINAVRTDSQGDLYLLIDQKDGVRVLKTDANAATVLAQAQIGAKGDIGLALALDPAGDVYVTGTTSSGALTATAGAAFLTASGTATNSFVAKFDANLNTFFVTFAGAPYLAASSIAATADAVFITGSIFSASLPVSPSAIIQMPAFGSSGNGFVEKFSASGGTLLYATYLSGANGNTTPNAIAVDSFDDAFVAGVTTSPGYPTTAAVIPAMLGSTSGFLTRLTPAGDGLTFSTFVPGAGITSLVLDPVANNLLLAGSISLGQFPVSIVQEPLTNTPYQTLLRMPLDGSSVLASTLLAPGAQSFVAAGASGSAWVAGSLGLPIFPLAPLASFGNSFAMRVNSANVVDQTARFGGLPATNGTSSAPVNLTSVAVSPSTDAIVAGAFAPSASGALLSAQTFDLPLATAPTAAFPSSVHAAVPPASSCNGSLCSGSAAFLARLVMPVSATNTSAALALSVDDSPNLTLRNLGSAQALALQISVSGFTSSTNCGSTLPAGAECNVALSGVGPGTVTVQASNAAAQSQPLPALPAGTAPVPVVFSPRELDFGIVSAASAPTTRIVTVTNLTQQSQTFNSAFNGNAKVTLPYTFTQQTSDCTPAGGTNLLLAPGASCHITVSLTASSNAANDGPIQATWLISTRPVQLTGYSQAAALSLSSAEVDFGTQYSNGLRLPRYLYLSNNSKTAASHSAVTLPQSSPFSVTDTCPSMLEPATVCQLQLAYLSARTPSADAVTLSLDQGMTVLVTGRSLPQPAANGASVNPNLSLSSAALTFGTAVTVTSVSAGTQTLTMMNTGASAFALSLVLTGDFIETSSCGATLAGGASCAVVFSFAPSQPGTRQGLLAVTAGAGTTPAYVTLTGVGTGLLTPASNGTVNFGPVIAGQPSVQWYKIGQPFTSFSAAVTSSTVGSPFTAVLVEDIGYGHGAPPPSAYTTSVTGTCFNCWLGIRFTPVTTGVETGTLTLTSSIGGSPYVLALTGTGLPLTGLLLTPVSQDFGPVPVNSSSSTALFVLTNLLSPAGTVMVSPPTVTGPFTVSTSPGGGAACGGPLAYSASCYIEVAFAPAASGPLTGTLTLQAGGSTATSPLSGYGLIDPGLALNPAALVFSNVPGATSTQQSITVTNTGTAPVQIGAPVATTSNSGVSSFVASTNCATLIVAASCSITVNFTPASAPVIGSLSIPVTSTVGGGSVLTSYLVPLTGAYTTEDAGIEILPNDVQFGPQATGVPGIARQFTIENLTAKSLSVSVALPRQFVLSGPPCSGLAPFASCNFSVAFLPLANEDVTGTLFAQALPTDGSATLNGIGYVEGYGLGAGTLSITGPLLPPGVLNFGQVPSGQTTQKTLTLTNTSTTSVVTIRRITSEWPFLATTSCGGTLAPGQVCTIAISYTPLNQVLTGSSSPPNLTDSGTLIIESDARSSPDLVDLTGSSTATALAAPSNVAPLPSFTPSQSSLTFAATMAGNISAPQAVTLANTGTSTIHILGIQTSADFTVSSNCASIVPGASCTLTVTFTPQSSAPAGLGASTRVSAIEISSDANTPLDFISVVGVASPSALAFSQSTLDFGTVNVGTQSTLALQITNTGTTPAAFASLATTGDYTAGSGTCPQAGLALAGGASCTIQITFSPSVPGTRTGTFSLASSASTLPLTAALTGYGAQSHLVLTPSTLGFGAIAIGASSVLSLTLSNTGNAAISGISTSISPAAASDFSVIVPCALTLAPGTSCTMTVSFSPSTTGSRSGSLTLVSSDASSPDTVLLSGSGVTNGSFTLTVNGSTTASSTVTSGSPAPFTLTVTPVNNFSGTVVLNCTPVAPALYADCSLLPSLLMLNGTVQTAVATINTVSSIAARSAPPLFSGRLANTLLCLLFPGVFFTWKAGTSRQRAWRRIAPLTWAVVSTLALLCASGCGGGSASTNLRYAPSGNYQYQVTASSVSGSTQVSQNVTLNVTIQ